VLSNHVMQIREGEGSLGRCYALKSLLEEKEEAQIGVDVESLE